MAVLGFRILGFPVVSMVPGAPVATSGILFAVPAFREWLRLSVRTTYHSPIPLSICGAPCRPALCPSRPPTFPPSDSPALRLSCPPPIAPSDLPARLSVCGSGSGFLPALHLRSFSPSCPPPIASSNLPARLTVCRLGPGSLPALHLRGFSPFRPLSVPPSVRSALRPSRPLSALPSGLFSAWPASFSS